MQIMNCAKGPRILSNGVETVPGTVVTVADEFWKKERESKVVKHWLTVGDLREVADVPAAAAPMAVVPSTGPAGAIKVATEAAAKPTKKVEPKKADA